MRKQYKSSGFHLPFIIAATMMMVACTLSMEEYVVPEEKQGFDEPVTIENEQGKCTYQYREGVRPITKNVQEYLVRVIDDSVLYFMDSTPKDWLPVAGGYVSASGSRKLPWGLNHRVLSVEKENGMYKVVLTGATRDEVFKEFNCLMEFDYDMPQYLPIDSVEAENTDSLSFIDFSLIEGDSTALNLVDAAEYRQALKKGKILTRADNKDKYKEEYDPTNIIVPIDVDLENLAFLMQGKESDKFEGIKLVGEFNYHKGSKQKIYLDERKSEDYRKYTVENFDTTIYYAQIGLQKNLKSYDIDDLVEKKKNYEELIDFQKALYIKNMAIKNATIRDKTKSFKDFIKGVGDKKRPLHFSIPSPFPAISIVFDISGGVEVNVLGYGTVEYTNIEPRRVKGYVYNKGEKTDIDQLVENGSGEFSKLNIGGQFQAEANIRLGVGMETTGSGLGGTIGVGAAVGIVVNAQMNIIDGDEATTYIVKDDENCCSFYVNWKVDAGLHWSPGGFTIANPTWPLYEGEIYKKTKYFKPVLDRKRIKKTWTYQPFTKKDEDGEDYTENELVFNNSFGWSQLWWFDPIQTAANGIPGVRVYHGSYDGKYKDFPVGWDSDAKYVFSKVIEGTDPNFDYTKVGVKSKTTYNVKFRYSDLLSNEDQYLVVPCMYNLQYHQIEEFRDAVNVFKFSKPTLEYVKGSFKWAAYPAATEFDPENPEKVKAFKEEFNKDDIEKYNIYQFQNTFLFKNTELVKEWGVVVRLWRGDDLVMEKEIPMEGAAGGLIRSGKKSVRIRFVTSYTPDPQQLDKQYFTSMRVVATLNDGTIVRSSFTNPVRMEYPHIWTYNDKNDGSLFSVSQRQSY